MYSPPRHYGGQTVLVCLNLRLRESGLLFLNTNFCGALKQGTEPVRTGCLLTGRGTPQREQARRIGRVLLSLTSSAADCVYLCFIHFLSTTLFAFSAMNNKINAQQKASTHTFICWAVFSLCFCSGWVHCRLQCTNHLLCECKAAQQQIAPSEMKMEEMLWLNIYFLFILLALFSLPVGRCSVHI